MKLSNAVIFTLLTSGILHAQVLPVLNTRIPDVDMVGSLSNHQIDLNNHFSTEAIDSQVVRFESIHTNATTGLPAVMDFALFSTRTPVSRTNFLNYVSSGAYVDSFIHRSLTNFVIQGGAYTAATFPVNAIPTDPPIVNEFGVSNTIGTISMAKLGGDPDSATSQWFVSTGGNSDNLDNQNGGFTVFGRVTQSTMQNALSFNNPATFPTYNFGGAFTNLPAATTFTNTATDPLEPDDLIRFSTVSLQPLPAGQAGTSSSLTYSVSTISDPNLVTGSLVSGQNVDFTLDPTYYGVSNVVVQSVDSVGNIVEETFTISNLPSTDYATWRAANWTGADLTDDAISGPNTDHDGDGHFNLVNFALGLDKDGRPSGQICIENVASSGSLDITFPMVKSNDVGYKIQHSSDLNQTNPWGDIPHTENTPRVDNGNTVKVTSSVPVNTANTKGFYRVLFLDQTP